MLVISGCSTSRATACISTASRSVGPLRAMPAQIHRRFHVHEGQRHEFGEAAGLRLQVAQHQQMPRPVTAGASTWPYMMVEVVRRPSACAARTTSSHCAVLILSGQMTARTSSSRISAAVPGSVPRPASFSSREEFAHRAAQRRRALRHFQRREGVDVHPRHRRLDRLADADIGRAGVVGMDAALQADFGGAALPGFARAAHDFVERRGRRACRAAPRASCPWRRRRTCSGSSRCWCS